MTDKELSNAKKVIKISDLPKYDIKNVSPIDVNRETPKAVKSGEDIKSLQDHYDATSPTRDAR